MLIDEILALFDRDVRANPRGGAMLRVERSDDAVLLTGKFDFVSYWSPNEGDAALLVARLAALYRSNGRELLWRVYGHDEPRILAALLAEEGFIPNTPGTLMFLDVESAPDPGQSHAIEVRRVTSHAGLDDYIAASGSAFENDEAQRARKAYQEELDDPHQYLFVAYADDVPVGAARLVMSNSFAHMFGGGVSPPYRGRGVYRALVAARVTVARQKGRRYLSTEARDSSRPILEHLGFAPATCETTWVLNRR